MTMKARILTTIAMACAIVAAMQAAPVSESTARGIAASWAAAHQMGALQAGRALRAPGKSTSGSGNAAYYVFNAAGSRGFVVVSGDDRTPAVLGYSHEGTFDGNDVPEALQSWLDGYARQIEALGDMAAAPAVPAAPARGALAPLLTTNWHQKAPYNNQCPAAGTGHCVAGCMAVAMAQVLNYYKSSLASAASLGLPSRTFRWDLLRDSYAATDNDAATDEVAALIYYCARAANTTFGASESSSSATTKLLIDYFGYSRQGAEIGRSDYTKEEWEGIIYDEIAARRPVTLYVRNAAAGHYMLCDGYDGDGAFHINWGWGGSYNGYYRLDVLNPYTPQMGDYYTASGFSLNHRAMIGIAPEQAGEVAQEGHVSVTGKMSCGSSSYSRASTSAPFTNVRVSVKLYASLYKGSNFDYGVALCRGNEILSVPAQENTTRSAEGVFSKSFTMQLGAGLADGDYQLRAVMRPAATAPWRLCDGATRNCVRLTLAGNTLATRVEEAFTRKLEVNSFTPVGSMVKGRPMAFEVNITNRGTQDCSNVYLYLKGSRVSASSVQIAPGETGTVTLCFTPSVTGTVTAELWDHDEMNLLASTQVTINESPEAKLTMSMAATNANADRTIAGTMLKGKVVVTNNHTLDYDEDIAIYAHSHEDGVEEPKHVQHLQLASGASTTIMVEFTGLVIGKKYYLGGHYVSKSKYVVGGWSSEYTMVAPPSVNEGDVDGNGTINGSDVTALYNHLLSGATCAGDPDVDGNGVVNGSDVTALYTILLK